MQVAEWKDSDKRVEDDRALQEVNGCNGAVGERSYCTCRDRTFSLQDAFAKFRKRRIAEKKKALTARAEISAVRGTEEFRRELRRLFCEQCLRYVGTPYGQRYHSETDCECEGCTQSGRQLFHSDLFLDCCGLVRRAVADLQEYFGFRLGPGNQVYQLDTLPIRKESIHELQPGDLVFYYGKYFSETAKPQLGNVVHVEVFLGSEMGTGPESVIGSRFSQQTVTVYDSYQFNSKKWELLGYEFCSIDTWLDGTLKNFNPDHQFAEGRYLVDADPGKYSLFAEDAPNSETEGDSRHIIISAPSIA